MSEPNKMPAAKLKHLMKRYKCIALPNGNILTTPARLSYPNIIAPGKTKDGKDVWKASLLFPFGADIETLEDACTACALDEFGSKWRRLGLNMPVRDQGTQTVIVDDDGTKEVKNGYAEGAMFVNANSYRKPGAVYSDGVTPIEDDGVLYPGAWVLASLRPGAYKGEENSGVKLWLQNVMFLADDEKLGGGGAATPGADFEGLQSPDDIDALFAADNDDDGDDDPMSQFA